MDRGWQCRWHAAISSEQFILQGLFQRGTLSLWLLLVYVAKVSVSEHTEKISIEMSMFADDTPMWVAENALEACNARLLGAVS